MVMNLAEHFEQRLKRELKTAPFVLRITEWKPELGPVLVIKERAQRGSNASSKAERLIARGQIKGEALRRLLPIIKRAVAHVADSAGVPLEIDRYLTREGLKLCLKLPLDEDAGARLALIAKLQERLLDPDRSELVARRVLQFTREEALYWLSRITDFGPDAGRWAISGLRILLGGHAGDDGIERMLDRVRTERAPRLSLQSAH